MVLVRLPPPGQEEGIRVHEVIRKKEVRLPERVSVERQIERLIDDPDATEQLLRTLAHRWRHRGPESTSTPTRKLSPTVLDIWQAFHAPGSGSREESAGARSHSRRRTPRPPGYGDPAQHLAEPPPTPRRTQHRRGLPNHRIHARPGHPPLHRTRKQQVKRMLTDNAGALA
jgi:hypothetical protein